MSPDPAGRSTDRPVAVVTGSSSGIGLAIARSLSARGAHVVLTARSADRLKAAAADLPGPTTAIPADVTDPAAAETVVGGALAEHGRIDVLVANAGIYVQGNVWENDPEDMARLISTNVTGVLRFVRAVLPAMRERGRGDVVVTSSVSGHQAIPGSPSTPRPSTHSRRSSSGVRRQLIGERRADHVHRPGHLLSDLWAVSDASQVEEGVATGNGCARKTSPTPSRSCSTGPAT